MPVGADILDLLWDFCRQRTNDCITARQFPLHLLPISMFRHRRTRIIIINRPIRLDGAYEHHEPREE